VTLYPGRRSNVRIGEMPDEASAVAIELDTPPTTVRVPGADSHTLPRISRRVWEPCLYAGAAVSYITIGVFVNEFVLSWVVAFAWLLFWVWGLPTLVQRLRR
jgi:hypothetical protein